MSSSSSSPKKKGRKSKGSSHGSKAWLIKQIRKMKGKASSKSTQDSLKKAYKSLKSKSKSSGKRGKGKAKGSPRSKSQSSKSGKKLVALYKKLQKRLHGKVPSASAVKAVRRSQMKKEIEKYRKMGVSPRKKKTGSKKRGSKYDLVNKIMKKGGLRSSARNDLLNARLSMLKDMAKQHGISVRKGKKKSSGKGKGKGRSSPSASAKSRMSDLQKLKASLRKKHPRMRSASINKLAQNKLKQQKYKSKGHSRTPSGAWIKEAGRYKRKFGSSPSKSMKLANIRKALKKKSLSPKKSPAKRTSPSKSKKASLKKPVMDSKHKSPSGGKHASPKSLKGSKLITRASPKTLKGSKLITRAPHKSGLVIEVVDTESSSESSSEFVSARSSTPKRKTGQYKVSKSGRMAELIPQEDD